jgi:hypothetical protein
MGVWFTAAAMLVDQFLRHFGVPLSWAFVCLRLADHHCRSVVSVKCGVMAREPDGGNMMLKVVLFTFWMIQTTISHAQVPFEPFRLLLVREDVEPALKSVNDVIRGKLYEVRGFAPSDIFVNHEEQYITDTLELPWVNNFTDFSSIPSGFYEAYVRTDSPTGKERWRIQLKGTGTRTLIQIHSGNFRDQIDGCILVGRAGSVPFTWRQPNPDSKNNSFVSVRSALAPSTVAVFDSEAAMKRIRERYGSQNHFYKRPIHILIRRAGDATSYSAPWITPPPPHYPNPSAVPTGP